jgi:hypothetical protein
MVGSTTIRPVHLVALIAILGACTARSVRTGGIVTAVGGGAIVAGAGISKATGQTDEPYEVAGLGVALLLGGLIVAAVADEAVDEPATAKPR